MIEAKSVQCVGEIKVEEWSTSIEKRQGVLRSDRPGPSTFILSISISGLTFAIWTEFL
jgi:hypothetical protein